MGPLITFLLGALGVATASQPSATTAPPLAGTGSPRPNLP